jgi:Na+/citrate or Na+/malate symporter
MALADLMKKGFLTSATATVATPATHERVKPSTVATVAGVAVAKLPKVKNIYSPAKEKSSLADTLALFRFELIQQEIEDGHQSDELHRVNNMTWEFMQADGMSFTDAMKLSSEITISKQVAVCEAAYVDVMALFKKVNQ